jgi:hypothetical protein
VKQLAWLLSQKIVSLVIQLAFKKNLIYIFFILDSQDITTNNFINFDEIIFSPTGFRHAYDDLTLTESKYHHQPRFKLHNLYYYS